MYIFSGADYNSADGVLEFHKYPRGYGDYKK